MKKLCLLVFLLTGCLHFDIVVQPSSVEIGERFTITVDGVHDYSSAVLSAWLAMLLPTGFAVDSVNYIFDDTIQDVGLPCPLIADYMERTYPPDSGTRWQAFATDGYCPDTSGKFSAKVFVSVTDCTGPGSYLVDYYLGYSDWNMTGGTSDSLLDQPMTVTGLAVADSRAEPAPARRGLWPVVFRDRLNISVAEPDDIRIFDTGGRLVRTLRVERSGFWDGTDESGRRVPAGAYLVRGRSICDRAMLVD